MGEFNKNKYIFLDTTSILEMGEEARGIRETQISLMIKELFLYKIFLKDLVSLTPNYRDRNIILNIAYYVITEVDIYEKIQKKRELPLNLIGKKTKVSRTFLELWHDYILAYIVILANPNYKTIQDYLRIQENDGSTIIPLNSKEKDKDYRGIVIKVSKRSAIILTPSGEFIKIKNNECLVGREEVSKEKKGLKHYRAHIAILLVMLIFIAIAIYNKYVTVDKIVMVQTTSTIKMNLNDFDRVIYLYSETSKGKEMLANLDLLDKDVDEVLKDIIEYANNNDMIPNNSILITVNGNPLEYGKLSETGKYIVENNISVLINNSGNEHKLYESTLNQKEDQDEVKEE